MPAPSETIAQQLPVPAHSVGGVGGGLGGPADPSCTGSSPADCACPGRCRLPSCSESELSSKVKSAQPKLYVNPSTAALISSLSKFFLLLSPGFGPRRLGSTPPGGTASAAAAPFSASEAGAADADADGSAEPARQNCAQAAGGRSGSRFAQKLDQFAGGRSSSSSASPNSPSSSFDMDSVQGPRLVT
jgi:hypothetical protein